MDVNYDKDVWEKKRQAVGGLLSYGIWGAGTDLVEYLGQVDNLLTEMENDINTLDVDNALCFSFESNKNAYTELRSDYDILYKYTGEVNTVVERAIDDPFYKKMDAFVEGMEKANIENYKTSAALGFGEWDNFNGSYSGQVLDDVTINDIYNDNNPFADQMYEAYRIYAIAHNESKQYACTADELLSREAFQKGMLNMYGFDYRSINDGAEESELIRDIVATIVITGVSVAAGIVFTPAAGFAVFAGLGAAYSSLDVGSAITGQDISGRNLEDGERLSRLFFAVAGVVPIGRAGGLAEDGISLASRLGEKASGAGKLRNPEIGNKLDYLFGKARGNKHNIQRSQTMQSELSKIGIYDTPSSRELLNSHLKDVLNDSSNILKTESRSYIAKELSGQPTVNYTATVRESFLKGSHSGVKIESVWDGDRLLTIIVKGGK
ncbi:hypothetical protein HB825_10445 [Listeria booriae]|uniref:hypothetical protein n=1 Tax=Listeria booriae TaxID=1552123 RepID=UPI00164D4D1D|nr:hypothetical protein [Listeria booriae]MBC6135252.1 hypothetical protein [Listeria booriae]